MQNRPSSLVLNTGSPRLLAGEHSYTTPASITHTPHPAPHAPRELDDRLNPLQHFSYFLSQKLSHSTEEEARFAQTGSGDARNQTRLCVSKASALPTLLPSPPTRAGEAWKEGRRMRERWGGGEGEGEREGKGGKGGGGAQGCGRETAWPEHPCLQVLFLFPIPSFLGENCVCTTSGDLEQRSPQPPSRTPKGRPPPACCLGDAGDARAVVCFLLYHRERKT